MQKLIIYLFAFIILLTSCSVTSTPPSTYSNVVYEPELTNSESILASSDSLFVGESYRNMKIDTKREYFSKTQVILPILPTDELNQKLHTAIADFLSRLDYPFHPEFVDFYCEEAFSTRTFTFYVSDTFEQSDKANLYFSYNTETNSVTLPKDFFDAKTINLFLGEDTSVKEMKVTEMGVFLRTENNEYFIDRNNFRFEKLISVFHPENYSPVINNEEKYVALTFDDGPNPYTTSVLIDMLEKKGVKVTFFMVGYNIENYRSTVKKVYDHGHDIGIHSYAHSDYSLMSGLEIIDDIDRCSNMVYSITGKSPYLVRPPFGNINMENIDTDKYFFVNWNVDPLDWNIHEAEKIAEKAINATRSGSIILLHDIYKESCDAAEIIIDELLEKGYRFVTISEYFDLNGKKTDNKLHFLRGDYNGKEY